MMDSDDLPQAPLQPADTAVDVHPGNALSPGDLEDVLKIKLDQLCAGILEWNFSTSVVGILGEVPDARYSGTIYRLPLIDPGNPGIAAHLNVREALLKRSGVCAGDLVRATGQVVPELFQGKLSFRLKALSLAQEELSERQPGRRSEHGTLDLVRKLALDRHAFPSTTRPSLALIHPASSDAKVVQDFLAALGPGATGCSVRRMPVSMHDPGAIAAALEAAKDAIVVVIRGGGDATAFHVFEDAGLLAALGKVDGYRVLGLGHSANRTIAELAADHAASTPAAAGEHVRRGLVAARRLIEVEGQNGDLREALTAQESKLRDLEARMPIVLDQPDDDFAGLPEPSPAGRERKPVLLWMATGAGIFWILSRLL